MVQSSLFLNLKDISFQNLEEIYPNLEDYLVFCVVKNPISRMVNLYNYRQNLKNRAKRWPFANFSAWIKSDSWRQGFKVSEEIKIEPIKEQYFYIDVDNMPLVIHYENHHEVWGCICDYLDIKSDTISIQKDDTSFLNGLDKILIKDFFAEDFELLGY